LVDFESGPDDLVDFRLFPEALSTYPYLVVSIVKRGRMPKALTFPWNDRSAALSASSDIIHPIHSLGFGGKNYDSQYQKRESEARRGRIILMQVSARSR
jgi:hypothetical protein